MSSPRGPTTTDIAPGGEDGFDDEVGLVAVNVVACAGSHDLAAAG